MKVKKPTYEELLKKVNAQEIEINNLHKAKSDSIKNYSDFLIGNEILRDTFDRITDSFVALDDNDCYTFMNKKCGEFVNRDPDEMIGKHIWTEFPESKNEPFYKAYQKAKETQQYTYIDEYYSPYEVWIEGNIYPSANGISIFFREVTEKKKTSLKVLENEKKFRALVENNDGLITVIDKNLKVVFRSSSSERVTGWTDEELENINDNDYYHPDHINYINDKKLEALRNPGEIIPISIYVKHKKGHYICLEGTVNNLLNDNIVNGFVFNLKDVSERIEAKQKLIKANHLYSFISQINQMIVRTTDSQTLFNEVCAIAIALGKFKMTWIGLINEKTNTVEPVVIAGIGQEYVTKITPIKLNHITTKLGPIQKVILNNKYVVCNDFESNDLLINCKEDTIKNGYKSLMIVPLRKFNKIIGVFAFYSEEKNYFDAEEIKLINDVNNDICFALEVLEKEKLRKIAEEKVLESEKIYHSLTEVSPVGIFKTDSYGDTTYVNKKWCKITGLSFKKALGKGWINALHKDDRYRLLHEWKNVVVKNKIASTEYRFVQPDGNIVWVIGNAIPEKNKNNEVVGYIGTITDITERKQSEVEFIKVHHKMKAILDAIPDLLFEVDIDGKIHNYHSGNEKLLLMPVKLFLGKNISEILPKDVVETCKKGIQEAAKKGFSNGLQYKLELPSGVHWFELSIAIMSNSDENKAHFIVLSRNITERVVLELEITKAKELAETANRYKTEFLANMSHEIRTPLNGIIGFSQLLMRSSLEENQLDYMNTINESATSLMQIVNDVLDFSEIESGKLKIIIDDVNLYDLSNQTINLFKYQASQKDINLVLNIDQDVPHFVLTDAFRLKQVLLNLLSNALKFTSIGTINLNITVLPSTNKNYSNIHFSVTDTGIGIKKSNQKNIFNSFVQEDNSTRRKFGGTGLGLTISNKLLALMNSKLELESEKNFGSNFYFTIKVKKSNSKKNELNSIPTIINHTSKILESKKLLIVEDNKINMFLIKTLVKKIVPNAIIVEAFDGNEAIKAYEKENFDIILIDVQMPNMNGYDATTHIRSLENSSKIPIIAITAGILLEEKQKCFECGMNDYLPKPIVFDDLETKLYKWLKD